MSRRAGNNGENLFCKMAEALGYAAYPARGSRGVVDVVCFDTVQQGEPWKRAGTALEAHFQKPPLAVQVGTSAKPIARTLAELQAAPRPIGSLCVVARRLARKGRSRPWSFHTHAGRFDTLAEALDAR